MCVRQPSFFEHLSTVLAEPAHRGLAGLAAQPCAALAAPYLTDDFVETNFDFYGRTLNGTPELRARWKRGVALVEGAVGEAVGKEYVARHFPPDVQGADGRPGREPARGLPLSISRSTG